jgi:hypothetical protein
MLQRSTGKKESEDGGCVGVVKDGVVQCNFGVMVPRKDGIFREIPVNGIQ